MYTKEYYWFSQYMIITSTLVLTIIWSILPSSLGEAAPKQFINTLLDIFPQRRWIITLESIMLMGMLCTYIGLLMYNEDTLTPPLDSLSTVTDAGGQLVIEDDPDVFVKKWAFKETSGIYDLPLMDACHLLYLYDNDHTST
ncbi:CPA_1a_G0012850.mRNA.1.CDS.1 [Saccharomyces cerevisiae]|nr:Gpi19p [Saccharomyces cerevisiae YJM1399]CAI4368429.1 CPA_1a_G0012850.mRNA.1.CDS.1 [Saccharomyces cerevisiae]CAI4374928.1 ADE_G0012600.mRNA.1.CDS.1 [Saccharomyces cerevisiae]CAI6582027.1 ADE_G0012600.mRNA.1.CDS.1 [Saccharomyces cerevisiae]CAI7224992.1 CPA_1a_G0012850.mRNA.1.CDS.1 [Saccharomyces cerevisiae]